jgi:hypothetical protein
MRRPLPWLWLVLALATGNSPAHAQSAAFMPPYRYLFVYDASSSMAKAAPIGGQAIADLIYSGIQGQLKPGDVFGVWLFNQQVFTNRFAPMTWHPGAHQALSDNTLALLKTVRYEKDSKLDVMWREVLQAARASENLTVMIITDGDQPFKGTPFDGILNRLTKEHLKELRRAKRPLLATLVAKKGQFVAYTIGPAGQPIDFSSLGIQLERVYPSEPVAPLVTNIITTNFVIITNPVAAAPLVTHLPRASEAANPDVVIPAIQEIKPPPMVFEESNSPANQVIFAQPPPLKPTVPPAPVTAVEEVRPALTNEPAATPEPAATASEASVPTMARSEPTKPETNAVGEPAPSTNLVATPQKNVDTTSNAIPTPLPSAVKPPAPAAQESSAKPNPFYEKWGFALFACASVFAGLAVFAILLRSTKRKARPSFISQSIDRNLK